jgi:hypothetical protein
MSNNAQRRTRRRFGDSLWPGRSGWTSLPRLRLLGARTRPLFFGVRLPAGAGLGVGWGEGFLDSELPIFYFCYFLFLFF